MVVEAEEWAGEAIEEDEAEVAAAEAARESSRDFKLLLLLRGLRLRMEPSALLRRRVGVVRPSVLPVGRPSRPTADWRSLNS